MKKENWTTERWKVECDKLLTPFIIKKFPNCMLCGSPTQVAHHHIHRSKSLRVRYEIQNLLPLCGSCHYKLHQNESYWASKIIQIRGLRWFARLEKLKNEVVKWGKEDYKRIYRKLKNGIV